MLRVGYKGMVAFSLKLQNIPQLETDCTQINYIIRIYSSVFFIINIITTYHYHYHYHYDYCYFCYYYYYYYLQKLLFYNAKLATSLVLGYKAVLFYMAYFKET